MKNWVHISPFLYRFVPTCPGICRDKSGQKGINMYSGFHFLSRVVPQSSPFVPAFSGMSQRKVGCYKDADTTVSKLQGHNPIKQSHTFFTKKIKCLGKRLSHYNFFCSIWVSKHFKHPIENTYTFFYLQTFFPNSNPQIEDYFEVIYHLKINTDRNVSFFQSKLSC